MKIEACDVNGDTVIVESVECWDAAHVRFDELIKSAKKNGYYSVILWNMEAKRPDHRMVKDFAR